MRDPFVEYVAALKRVGKPDATADDFHRLFVALSTVLITASLTMIGAVLLVASIRYTISN